MTTYLKGSKRLAIIHRWLQGIDDPEYDVLPTKKEGKYIVKKRTAPMKKTTEQVEQHVEQDEQQDVEQVEQQQSDTEQVEPEQEEQQESPPPQPVPKTTIKPKSTIKPSSKPKSTPIYDPTVNLEILEQLKLLGDEIRSKRERKEQKQLIKQVVEKQIRKRPPTIPLSQPVEEYEYYSDDEPTQPIFKSRIRR